MTVGSSSRVIWLHLHMFSLKVLYLHASITYLKPGPDFICIHSFSKGIDAENQEHLLSLLTTNKTMDQAHPPVQPNKL